MNAPSSTEKWLSPSDWVARLHQRLVTLDTQYIAFKGVEQMKIDPDTVGNDEIASSDPRANATLTATAALAAVITALKEIPTFQGNVSLVALSDLAGALVDLHDGGQPKMLTPRSNMPAPGDGFARRFIKVHAVLCTELLKAAGQKAAPARFNVAKIFAAAGHKGRKGGALSPKTLYEWELELSASDDTHSRTVIETAITEWKLKRSWPPVITDVLDFTRDKARDPSMMTKI